MFRRDPEALLRFRGRGGPPGASGIRMGGPKGFTMRPQAPMMSRPEPEEITIEDDNDAPIVVPQQRRVVPPPRLGPRGRGARRGRPRLDPDTDLGKFSIKFFPL